jgi:hypothetical protein
MDTNDHYYFIIKDISFFHIDIETIMIMSYIKYKSSLFKKLAAALLLRLIQTILILVANTLLSRQSLEV